MSVMTNTKSSLSSHDLVVRLCISGIMIALSTVLSLVTIIKMPMGGSVTPVSMLPVCMIAIMYGTKWGLCTSFAYALVQLILDYAAAVSWGLSVPALIACFVFDYLLAFTMLGFAGVFRKHAVWGVPAGVALACVLRFICHVISGSTVFAVWMPDGWSSPLLYALAYNGLFMAPELFLTAGAAFAFSKVPAIRQKIAA